MNQDELMKFLIEELFKMDELHQEYQDNDTHFVIDTTKNNNTLNIKVELIENKDKKEFEKWLENVDDNLFGEVLTELQSEGLDNLEDIYESEDYKKVIEKVKSKTKEIALRKINEFQKLIK